MSVFLNRNIFFFKGGWSVYCFEWLFGGFLHLGFHRGTGLGKSWSRRWVLRMKHVHLSQWVWVPFSAPFFLQRCKKKQTWNLMKPEMDDFQKKSILPNKTSSFPLGFSRLARLGRHLVLCWKKARCEISLRPYLGTMAWWTSSGGLWKWSWDTR